MKDGQSTEQINYKELREKKLMNLFEEGTIKFKLVSTRMGWAKSIREDILLFKEILQKQLPRMPREYIFKQIFNEKHNNILCFLKDRMIGGVCYRSFYEKNFIEIVFLAVESDVQVTGHGSMIIDILKEHIKREIQNIESDFLDYLNYPTKMKFPIYILTYADNYAIGFFKKQGFGTEIYFKNWQGYIKDYEGGTLVQCKVHWEINYLKKLEYIEKKRLEFISRMNKKSNFNLLRGPIDFKQITSIWDIPGLKDAQFKEEMFLSENKSLKNVFRYILSDIRTDTHAWPFLIPVNSKEVPDYYQIIKHPMDLSTMEKNIENDSYKTLEEFESDFRKIFKNCYTYNAPSTTYCKCANVLEKKFNSKLNEVKYVSETNTKIKNIRDNILKEMDTTQDKTRGPPLSKRRIKTPVHDNNTPQTNDFQPMRNEISIKKKNQPSTIMNFNIVQPLNISKLNNTKMFTNPAAKIKSETKKHEEPDETKKESDEDDLFHMDLMEGHSGDFF